ncbi:ABC transporter ATP-binding protein [bacterium]|nr:ABC transporter ATP-binding protein [bacterium]
MDRKMIIKVENLVKKFGNFTAVDRISFQVPRGEIFGFLGANGAGKTTAIKMLCGLSKPTSGSATIAGYDLVKEAEQVKLNIGYMSQKFSLYDDLTISENIDFYGGLYRLRGQELSKKKEAILQELGLRDQKRDLVKSLPLGWKQKLAFSVATIHEPKILFLDEPTSGVDPITRRKFWEIIIATANKGITIFITTHYLDEAEYCDRISIMVNGKIIALDSPANLKAQLNVDTTAQIFAQLTR